VTFEVRPHEATHRREMVAAFLHEDTRHAEVAEDPAGGTAREDYLGEVTVDRRTFTQTAHAVTTFDLT
jgi:hypothetical protein